MAKRQVKIMAKNKKRAAGKIKQKVLKRPKDERIAKPKVLYICNICDLDFDTKYKLKCHVVERHYKDELYQSLPDKAPFTCPVCGKASRDRITLLRHYALTEKAIFDHCSLENLEGEEEEVRQT